MTFEVHIVNGCQGIDIGFVGGIHRGKGCLPNVSVSTFHKADIVAMRQLDTFSVFIGNRLKANISVVKHGEGVVDSGGYIAHQSEELFLLFRQNMLLRAE